MIVVDIEECIEHSKEKLIVFEELKRRAIFKNDAKRHFLKFRFDGCMVVQQPAADFLLVCKSTKDKIIIELKGKNVEQAVKQIESTIEILKETGFECRRIAGLIVCSQVPHGTHSQVLKNSFAKKYNALLTIVTKEREFAFEDFHPPIKAAKKRRRKVTSTA
jgi:very-short-patch-repair endonuclease